MMFLLKKFRKEKQLDKIPLVFEIFWRSTRTQFMNIGSCQMCYNADLLFIIQSEVYF